MMRRLSRACRLSVSSGAIRGTANSADRAAWFTHVWQAAQSSAGAAKGASSDIAPAATAAQLLAVRAPDGTFPRDLALRLWATYEAADRDATSVVSAAIEKELGAVKAHRIGFFLTLAQLGVDLATLRHESNELAAALSKVGDNDRGTAAAHRALAKASSLRERCTPLYERWFQRMLAVPDGAKSLITMRAHLLSCTGALGKVAKSAGDEALRAEAKQLLDDVDPVVSSLTAVLREWTSAAWLTIDELSWSKTPAMVAEQMVRHEAVHKFSGLEDVKRRMQPSPHRRAFALFHPAVIAEPLTMVVVALTHGIADNVDSILRTGGSDALLDFAAVPHSHPLKPSGYAGGATDVAPDTAIFYSITSTQSGLRGIELGNGLIKGAVKQIQRSAPGIQQFSTLPPIPAYGGWLTQHVRSSSPGAPDADANIALAARFGVADATDVDAAELADAFASYLDTAVANGTEDVTANVLNTLANPRRGSVAWWESQRLANAMRPLLTASVQHYLTNVKRRGKAFDPVTNFHVRNGASLYRLNWLANCTDKASAASGGVMVNYLYDLARVEENAARYAATGHIHTTGFSNVGGPSSRASRT